jgi:hypothetical protein
MTDRAEPLTYATLDPAGRRCVQTVYDIMIAGIEDYAARMERGEIEMRSGPDALRDYAATLIGELLRRRPT